MTSYYQYILKLNLFPYIKLFLNNRYYNRWTLCKICKYTLHKTMRTRPTFIGTSKQNVSLHCSIGWKKILLLLKTIPINENPKSRQKRTHQQRVYTTRRLNCKDSKWVVHVEKFDKSHKLHHVGILHLNNTYGVYCTYANIINTRTTWF